MPTVPFCDLGDAYGHTEWEKQQNKRFLNDNMLQVTGQQFSGSGRGQQQFNEQNEQTQAYQRPEQSQLQPYQAQAQQPYRNPQPQVSNLPNFPTFNNAMACMNRNNMFQNDIDLDVLNRRNNYYNNLDYPQRFGGGSVTGYVGSRQSNQFSYDNVQQLPQLIKEHFSNFKPLEYFKSHDRIDQLLQITIVILFVSLFLQIFDLIYN